MTQLAGVDPSRPFSLLFRGRPCRIWRDYVNPADPNDGWVVIQFENGGAVAVANVKELAAKP